MLYTIGSANDSAHAIVSVRSTTLQSPVRRCRMANASKPTRRTTLHSSRSRYGCMSAKNSARYATTYRISSARALFSLVSLSTRAVPVLTEMRSRLLD